MSVWFRVAALSGSSSIAAGAYGAHGLTVDSPLMKAYENGNRLHMLHSVMLAVCPMLRRPHLSGCLFLGGTAVFSGSCYFAALSNDRRNGRFAPIGGTALIVAWLSLLL
mmetsp:Transcript_6565/g.10088  ORF Transcript_6565/g.10088 Transcript_6565/m.10088 type:complete len:109 (+) Transcript_6565:41-367(+)|eukprot:CAMPEP_0184396442 /NCGR_PEP_ID=MMETSP0007-20130409/51154_1 /TAXON_ID=97485 /ORGANISM="Prymnesium parvum, Strain Texoma1" /LENGTH=108 /DNA_ID=CAMNT_0026749205 /DNA_START=13 /DNA_END=339 /DNA_ORIENTATION=-